MSAVRKRHILIVEDNRDLAKGMSILLKYAGFEVETVHDGWEALRVSRARPPDAVLLDIGLPGLDGFQVSEAMRKEPDLKTVLIVAVSAYDQAAFPGRSKQAGFDHQLVKPVSFQTISSLLESAL
jgi:DNA-binding response OmpR family regulator